MTKRHPDHPPADATAMPGALQVVFWLGFSATGILLLAAFASGPVYLVLAALSGLIFGWCFISWLIYVALHRLPRGKRLTFTMLFLLLPALTLATLCRIYWVNGHEGTSLPTETAKADTAFMGAVFPAGSQLDYVVDGIFGRKLIAARASTPVTLGKLSVHAIERDIIDQDTWRLSLSQPQSIDGWLCSNTENDRAPRVRFAGNAILLRSCTLEAQQVGDVQWPSGTKVATQDDGGWWIYGSSSDAADEHAPCTNPIVIAAVNYRLVTGTYDQQHKSLIISDSSIPCESASAASTSLQ